MNQVEQRAISTIMNILILKISMNGVSGSLNESKSRIDFTMVNAMSLLSVDFH